MKKIVAVLVSLTFVILGCDGGGGSSDTTTPAVETTIKTSVTNEEEGVAKFVDSSTGEDVNVYISDIDGNPIPGINVEFWDADNYEFFMITDPSEKCVSTFEIYPHNSDHWITMYLPLQIYADEIKEILITSEKGQAMENFLNEMAERRIYHGRFTAEEIDEAIENTLTVLSIVSTTGIDGGFFAYVSMLYDFVEIADEIGLIQIPEYYDIYTLYPLPLAYFVPAVDENALCTDNDGDKYYIEGGVCGEPDCDDNNYYINPGAIEICYDNIDNNCNGQIDEGCNEPTCTDTDGDGYFVEGGACGEVDCNDNNANINPGAVEVCDGIDNDCDGVVDEGCNEPICTDADADGYFVEGGACGEPDCDDNNYYINPGVEEICDGIDNNCNGQIDEGCNEPICTDADVDGYSVEGGECGEIDCNDNNANINPGAIEVCDGIDNNCDGVVDEGCSGIPNAPTNFVATDMGSYLACLTWDDNSHNEDGFRMEAYIDVINAGGWDWYGSNWEKSGVYVECGSSLYEWQFRVRSFNDVGYSDWVYTTIIFEY